MKPNSRYSQELLSMGLLYAAFKERIEQSKVSFDDLECVARNYCYSVRIAKDFLQAHCICLDGVDRLSVTLKSLENRPVIIAATELGCVNLIAIGLSRLGLHAAIPYWNMYPIHSEICNVCEHKTLNIDNYGSIYQLCLDLRSAVNLGFLPTLMLEAPSGTQKRSSFLGYNVSASRLIEVCSKFLDAVVVIVWSGMISTKRPILYHKLLTDSEDLKTQNMLDVLHNEICASPLNYNWSGARVIFSDQNAVNGSFKSIKMIADWRQAHLQQLDKMATTGIVC